MHLSAAYSGCCRQERTTKGPDFGYVKRALIKGKGTHISNTLSKRLYFCYITAKEGRDRAPPISFRIPMCIYILNPTAAFPLQLSSLPSYRLSQFSINLKMGVILYGNSVSATSRLICSRRLINTVITLSSMTFAFEPAAPATAPL